MASHQLAYRVCSEEMVVEMGSSGHRSVGAPRRGFGWMFSALLSHKKASAHSVMTSLPTVNMAAGGVGTENCLMGSVQGDMAPVSGKVPASLLSWVLSQTERNKVAPEAPR